MNSESGEVLEMATMIARDYLHGPWRKATPKNITLKQIKGGLSNWLYQLSLPKMCIEQERRVPQTVLLRFHGQANGESAFEHIITESVIFTLLSERGLGPKLHGIFPGGRIEEYINARPLIVTEMSDPKISSIIAHKMAEVHLLQVPICKRPTWMYNLSLKYLNTIHNILQRSCENNGCEYFDKYDMRSELDWLRSYIDSIRAPVVFCHNDMNEGNILIPLDQSKSITDLVLIDFEYCAYNYRGFDIANHFVEHTITYLDQSPYFTINESDYPSEAFQVEFIKNYLRSYNKCSSIDNPDDSDFENSVKELVKEVDSFRIAVHFFWALWSAANSSSKIPFGYWEFASARLETYFNLKEDILTFEVPGSKRQKT